MEIAIVVARETMSRFKVAMSHADQRPRLQRIPLVSALLCGARFGAARIEGKQVNTAMLQQRPDFRNPPAVAESAGDSAYWITDFLDGYSIETTPTGASRIASFKELLPAGTAVYITNVRGTGNADVVNLAARLTREGMTPVPHIVARSTPDRSRLDDILARLAGEAGVDRALLIAGDVERPIGVFDDTMQVIETGLFDRHCFRRIGLAGHPEGNRTISDAALRDALAWKNAFADKSDADLYLVTQFAFDAAPVIEWDRRVRAEGNRLPIHVGIPGPANIKTLLDYARICGIGPSVRALSRRAGGFARLALEMTPDRIVADLARYRSMDPDCGIVRAHVFPFGGLARASAWLSAKGR